MDRWLITRDATSILLARPGARRLDVGVDARFPSLRPEVLAHEIRKDMWRSLRDVRGYSPVVRVAWDGTGLTVTAGGQIATGTWPREKTLTMIDALLSNPVKRARWIAHARMP